MSAIETRLAEDMDLAGCRLLVVDGDGWHRGVIGILASRVVERTAKPAIVVSVEDGVAHGSGRSVDGFHLLEAIETCGDLFTRFGGHAHRRRLRHARRRASRTQAPTRPARRGAPRAARARTAACAFTPSCRSTASRRCSPGWLRKLEPLGHGNPEPIFIARRARIATSPRVMKDRHIRLELAQEPAQVTGVQPGVVRAVGWDWAARCMDLQLCQGSLIDVAYRIRENDHPDFGGIEVEIAGVRPAEA